MRAVALDAEAHSGGLGAGALAGGPAAGTEAGGRIAHASHRVDHEDPFNQGTARGTTGLFPRGANQSLDAYAAIIQSYCDIGDPFCAGGANLGAHLNYTNRYNSAALSFVVGKLNASGVR